MMTKDKLAEALRAIGLTEMADKAAKGYYDDFLSPLDAPCIQLVRDLQAVGTSQASALAERAMEGDFDSTEEESEEWANSPEGQEALQGLLRP